MWCTRWYLPLLLLPLPTAPPYFLLLFIFSLTLHAKPCFYCIVLVSSIFVSSCYWQPFSIDTALSTPWSDNITTYGDALLASLSQDTHVEAIPSAIRAADRCWCDVSSGSLFESYNITRWEHNTVNKLKDDIERKRRAVASNETVEETATTLAPSKSRNIANSLWSMFARTRSNEKIAPSAGIVDEVFMAIPSDAFNRKYDLNSYGVNILVDFGWSD